MKKSKEYRISIGMSCVALALLCVALISGVVGGLGPYIEKVCYFLGIASICLSFVFLDRSEKRKTSSTGTQRSETKV